MSLSYKPVIYLVQEERYPPSRPNRHYPWKFENVSVISTTLRGVGFRGGSYSEEDVLPLIGAPTTEMRGIHTPFLSDVYYPVLPWRVNYFDALDGGDTRLMVTPVQHKTSPEITEPQLSTRRQFSDMDLRLYYSGNVKTFGDENTSSTPGPGRPAGYRPRFCGARQQRGQLPRDCGRQSGRWYS